VCEGNIKADLKNVVSWCGPVSVAYFKTNWKYLDHISKYQHPKEERTLETLL
jgi:hypothetical protein